MDNSQIAAIRGSFFNYLKNNPSIATALFSGYDSSAIWSIDAGDPSGTPTVESYYFDNTTGNIWYYNGIDSPALYSYLCCLFDTHSNRYIKIDYDYTDLNAVAPGTTLLYFSVPSIAKYEFISTSYMITNVMGEDSANNNDLQAMVVDALSLNELLIGYTLENVPAPNLSPCVNAGITQLYSSGILTYKICFSSSDLSLLTAGNWSLILVVESLP
jgi:hypothetical protein